ncbi:reverse transcriptase [Plakobranchus ocellatus]|uniref:Reverse transcriptase n=1 Tax=Plakobranchus ocellatus TaxID=259542 RepID=A0AAV3ZWU6_9GAST|nr:reverse transcriptase [Plakobranchus ocellatus]
MGCLSMSSQQQRTAVADKMLENQSQVQNHSAKEIQAENRGDVLRHPSSDKRRKINFPPASSGKAESARKKRNQKRENQERFIGDPFQFARQLFQQSKSGTLIVVREELETHLKETYSDPTREIPLEKTTSLVWPATPGIKFDSKPPSLQEVIAVVNKTRAKSAPGPNGVLYLLYKRCPNVLKKLHKILQSAWKNIKISKEWMTAEGVYIPKEQDSKEINQFRPISLLNVEGKIFFSIMASRLTKYLTENGYINTSVQKGGIPGVSGCLEHATMIWEAIQRAKSEKLNLDVVWLDLANAHGSVPHEMIQLALRMYHAPEIIQVMLDDYFSGFRMRFSTNDYTTNWINLEV